MIPLDSEPSEISDHLIKGGARLTAVEMPIFTRTFDFIAWLLPATNHFPRAHRHTATRRLLDAAFDLRERLEEANLRSRQARLDRLLEAASSRPTRRWRGSASTCDWSRSWDG